MSSVRRAGWVAGAMLALFGFSATHATPVSASSPQSSTSYSVTVMNPSATKTYYYGQPITADAYVTSTAATWSGTVTFSLDNSKIGNASVSSASPVGSMAIPIPIAVGSHTLTASFSAGGGASNTASASQNFVVSKAGTATSITDSVNGKSVLLGTSVTFNAVVAPSQYGGSPTGSVTFYVNSTASPSTTITLRNGQAAWQTSSLPAGNNIIYASYSGDSNFSGGTGSFTQPVFTQVSSTTNPTPAPTPAPTPPPATAAATAPPRPTSSATSAPTATASASQFVLPLGTNSNTPLPPSAFDRAEIPAFIELPGLDSISVGQPLNLIIWLIPLNFLLWWGIIRAVRRGRRLTAITLQGS